MIKRLFLQFDTPAGHILDLFRSDQPLQAAKHTVLHYLKLGASAEEFVVTFDGDILDESQTLASLGIPEVAALVIEHRDTKNR